MRRIFKREGMQGVIRRIGHRVRHSSDRLFYMRVLTKPVDRFQPLLRPQVRRFTDATSEFSAIYRTFTDDTTFADRFSGRVFCDVAFVDGDPAAFLWTSLGDSKVPSLNAILRLAPKDAYIMEVYTRPEYRRKGAAVFLWNSVCQELSALGYNRLFCLMEVGNRPIKQLAETTGFTQCYLISIHRLAPVERLIATPCRPEYAGALRVERVGRGLLPFRRPRWALTVIEPWAEGSLLR
jgi:GNAT superfamily N-acetyltransferase